MPKNVIITPASGLIDFKDDAGNIDAFIQLDGSGNLNISNTGGNLSLGNTATDVYIGDGTNSVDIIFEQNGDIRALAGKTLTLGQSDSNIAVASPTTFNSTVTITGNLTVNGTTTTVNSTTLTVDDKNIELGSIASPTDVTADGGGITLKGTTDKTFNWVDATDAWTSSEDLNLLTGKVYEINGTSVLSATTLGSGVTGSSLTSVGTIATGVWNGTVITGQYGGTGVANTGKTITLGGNLTTSGAFTTTLTSTANTSVTLPTTGTLATLAGTETFTNKTIAAGSNTISGLTNSNLSGTAGITNANLANSTISGIALGSNLAALTIGTGLSGTSYNGSTGVTIAIDSTVATLTGTQTLTNKTLTSPTMTTPTLGVATATSVNKVAITAPATSATLTIADGKTLTASNTLTFTGTDASSVAFGAGGTVLYSGGALGTPSSATLTNATGLPVSGITASTSTAIGVGSIELGHATDTTIARSSAGVISVEGVVVPTISSTNTLTNKTLTSPIINSATLVTPVVDRIDWAASGTGVPAFTTRSAGTKLTLYPAIGASSADYAIGINSATLWSSIPTNVSDHYFKWYGGTTEVASLSGTGVLTVGSINNPTITGTLTAGGSAGTNGYYLQTTGSGIQWSEVSTTIGYNNSSMSSFPSGDYNGADAYIGQSGSANDAFGVSLLAIFTCMDPVGSLQTTDLGVLT